MTLRCLMRTLQFSFSGQFSIDGKCNGENSSFIHLTFKFDFAVHQIPKPVPGILPVLCALKNASNKCF
jgi:hypothetical protein